MGHTTFLPDSRWFDSVHPHIRGAYGCARYRLSCLLGSSPPTWGIRVDFYPCLIVPRFIPTYVGHTWFLPHLSTSLSVHPHLRGAYVPPGPLGAPVAGSSPPTWGIQAWPSEYSQLLRFIPTYVGHTATRSPLYHKYSVHPHLRGAYTDMGHADRAHAGSSPPTWGIQGAQQKASDKPRFIPTYVGHTGWRWNGKPRQTVHPHLRGAYQHPPPAATWQFGSSPPTWGILKALPCWRTIRRFIPTYVGHTYHPPEAYHRPPGSSPHTWGIRLATVAPLLVIRFIPTYVGHTALWGGHNPHPWFIPTYVGHTLDDMPLDVLKDGSSPPTWGILPWMRWYPM